MIVLKEGTIYSLANYNGEGRQVIAFASKRSKGTTSEEVVKMLIRRYEHLDSVKPRLFNRYLVMLFRMALYLMDVSRESRNGGIAESTERLSLNVQQVLRLLEQNEGNGDCMTDNSKEKHN